MVKFRGAYEMLPCVFFFRGEKFLFCSSYHRSWDIWISKLHAEEEPHAEQAWGERRTTRESGGVGVFYALMCFGSL
jgi:hypothetical protein